MFLLLPSSTLLCCMQCTQGAKELLEFGVSHSSVVQSSCSSATPKTTPVTQENLLITVSNTLKSPSGRPSTSCCGRQKHHLTDRRCPQQMSALDAQALSFNLSLYSGSHGSLILSDASDMGFLPPTWGHVNQLQHASHSTWRRPYPSIHSLHWEFTCPVKWARLNRWHFTQEVLRGHTVS